MTGAVEQLAEAATAFTEQSLEWAGERTGVSKALKSLQPPKIPKPKKPTPMPVADEAQAALARRRAVARRVSDRGRASTILTSDSETLG